MSDEEELQFTAQCNRCEWMIVDTEPGDPIERARVVRQKLIDHVEQEHPEPECPICHGPCQGH